MLVPLIFKFSLGAFYRDDEAEAGILISKSQWLVGNGRTALISCPTRWKTKKKGKSESSCTFSQIDVELHRQACVFKMPAEKKQQTLNDVGLERSEGILPVQTDVLHLTGTHHHGVTRETSSPQIGLID